MSIMLYPNVFVKEAASQVYGATISDRSWRNWKRICKIQPYVKLLTHEQASYLLTLAYLKAMSPKRQFTIIQVIQQLKARPLSQIVLEPKSIPDHDFVKGKDLPLIIKSVTKRHVTLRTLYRWANKYNLTFGYSRPIPRVQLEEWLKLADK